MKKILLIASLFLVLFSCKKEEETLPPTTYTIINNNVKFDSGIDYLDATLWEVVVFNKIGDDVVREDNFKSIAYGGGKTAKKEVIPGTEKIVVSFKLVPRESELYDLAANARKYTVTSYLLTANTDNTITLTGETMTTNSMKSSNSAFSLFNNLKTIILD